MKITVIITVDERGHMALEVTGPINGKDGLLTLLEEAHKLAEQSRLS